MGDDDRQAVDRPTHYTQGEVECIDAIRSALGRRGFVAFCRGNVIKYVWRCLAKGGVEDLEKANKYLLWAIDAMEGKHAANQMQTTNTDCKVARACDNQEWWR